MELLRMFLVEDNLILLKMNGAECGGKWITTPKLEQLLFGMIMMMEEAKLRDLQEVEQLEEFNII